MLYGGRTVCRTRVGVLLAYRESRDFPVLLYVPHVLPAKIREMRVGDAGARTSVLCRVKADP